MKAAVVACRAALIGVLVSPRPGLSDCFPGSENSECVLYEHYLYSGGAANPAWFCTRWRDNHTGYISVVGSAPLVTNQQLRDAVSNAYQAWKAHSSPPFPLFDLADADTSFNSYVAFVSDDVWRAAHLKPTVLAATATIRWEDGTIRRMITWIHLSPYWTWSADCFSDNCYDLHAQDLPTTLVHELGHWWKLKDLLYNDDQSLPREGCLNPDHVMYPAQSEAIPRRVPQPDEGLGLWNLYMQTVAVGSSFHALAGPAADTLRWEESEPSSSILYALYASASCWGPYSAIGSVPGVDGQSHYVFVSAAGYARPYYYKLVTTGGEEVFTISDRTAGAPSSPPQTPTGLEATVVYAGDGLAHVRLSWSETAGGNPSFYVYRSLSAMDQCSDQVSTFGPLTAPTFTDVSAPAGQSIQYRVRAFNSTGTSEATDIVRACISAGVTKPKDTLLVCFPLASDTVAADLTLNLGDCGLDVQDPDLSITAVRHADDDPSVHVWTDNWLSVTPASALAIPYTASDRKARLNLPHISGTGQLNFDFYSDGVPLLTDVSWQVVAGCNPDTMDFPGAAGWRRETVSTAGEKAFQSSIAVDASSNPHLAYFDWATHDVRYAHLSAGSWSRSSAFNNNCGVVDEEVSIAVDPGGNAHVAHPTCGLMYSHKASGAWITETLSSYAYAPALALDNSGNPSMCFVSAETLYYAHKAQGAWTYESVSTTQGHMAYVAIAFDQSNNPCIAFNVAENGHMAVKFAKRSGSAWAVTEVTQAGLGVGLAVSGNIAHIVYPRSDGLWHAYQSGTSWTTELIEQSPAVMNEPAGIKIDVVGEIHVVYQKGDPGVLRYARKVGSTWSVATVDTVDSPGGTGWFPSLVCSGGTCHASYVMRPFYYPTIDSEYGIVRHAWHRDNTPPGTINSLTIIAVGASSATLRWTAPGDDGSVGKALSYTMRKSTQPITDATWSQSTDVGSVPAPGQAGVSQSVTVSGLSAGLFWYFGIKAQDEAGNVGGLSNVTCVRTGSQPAICGDDSRAIPAADEALEFEYEGVVPNPGQGALSVRFTLPTGGQVSIEVVDIAGRRVAGTSEWIGPGQHLVDVGGRRGLAPGCYFIRFRYGEFVRTTSAILLK